ncbi:MAG: nucleotide exchange factor GrpE [Candidatus Babeliales bacterium]
MDNNKNEQNNFKNQETQSQQESHAQSGEQSEHHTEPMVVEEPTQEKVEQLDYKDLFLRVTADLKNYQRRVEKQKTEWTGIAQESIILKLVPVIEDLDRALSASVLSDQPAVNKWVEGLAVVQKNFKKALNEVGVEEVTSVGTFNPELQEAVAQIDSATHQSGQIVDVVSKGYKFKDKVIKYAQVVVAK